MAHFVQLDANNVAIPLIVVSDHDITDANGVEVESIGIALCHKLFGVDTNWKQTSYNGNMRGNYAGIGMTYMENVATLGVASTDIFISQQPYASWTVGVNTAAWYSPIPEPALTDEQIAAMSYYKWNETAYQADNTVGWELKTPE